LHCSNRLFSLTAKNVKPTDMVEARPSSPNFLPLANQKYNPPPTHATIVSLSSVTVRPRNLVETSLEFIVISRRLQQRDQRQRRLLSALLTSFVLSLPVSLSRPSFARKLKCDGTDTGVINILASSPDVLTIYITAYQQELVTSINAHARAPPQQNAHLHRPG
jgi:hypothetical protein